MVGVVARAIPSVRKCVEDGARRLLVSSFSEQVAEVLAAIRADFHMLLRPAKLVFSEIFQRPEKVYIHQIMSLPTWRL